MVKARKESEDPVMEMERMADSTFVAYAKQDKVFRAAFLSDREIYRTAVYVLGGLTLAALSVNIPESVIALGSAATGALVGLFADKPTGH